MKEIIASLEGNTINGKLTLSVVKQADDVGTTGKTVIRHLISNPSSPKDLGAILKDLGLDNTGPSADLQEICRTVIGDLGDVAAAIKKGNEKPVMRLVGEVMKRSHGKADPKETRRILLEILKE
jgi:aspartyl-tRNA(Asn)/glutamyl-tRNA(Gln) amidotransferase subunit B